MPVDAVIFDWGGTLTPWKTMDGRAWWLMAGELAGAGLVEPDRVTEVGELLCAAEERVWQRARDHSRSGTLAEVLAAAGLAPDETLLAIHAAEHEWATFADPDAKELLTGLRARGIRVGVLSNTIWTRAHHEGCFARDGLDSLIDGAVYTSEIPWTKPHPQAFRAAMAAIDAPHAHRCVFVGDRPFDDIYGAAQVGMRTVLVPHSDIPTVQHGHTQGRPDAVIQRLADLLAVIELW